jgi:hypothetical protein
MPSNSAFIITYPTTVTVPTTLTTCYIRVGTTSYTMTNCVVDSTARTISISDGLTRTFTSSGITIQIYLGPITNPPDDTSTESFTLISHTDNTFTYLIDEIDGGLIPSFGCSTPCKTCATSDTSKCYTCFTDLASILEKYYHNYQCLEECPDGYYGDDDYKC